MLSEKPILDDLSGSEGAGSFRKSWDSISFGSLSTLNTQKTSIIVRLKELSDEMNAPKGFFEIVGQHLLGDTKGNFSKIEKAPDLKDIISFMAELFLKCVEHAEVVLFVLDDVQWMDNLSWKVVQCILETSNNILFICGSRPRESHALSMDKDFWRKLTGVFKSEKRYSDIHIGPLKENEIRDLAAITLSCDAADLSSEFCDDIFNHSGGMPYFASEILDNCVRKKQCGKLDNGMIGWKGSDSKVCVD